MTKLKFNYSELKEIVIPSLSDTISRLNSAIIELSGISIPSDFRYFHTVKELQSSLKLTRNKIVEVKDWLVFSNNEYDNAIETIQSSLDGVEDITIKKRNMLVM